MQNYPTKYINYKLPGETILQLPVHLEESLRHPLRVGLAQELGLVVGIYGGLVGYRTGVVLAYPSLFVFNSKSLFPISDKFGHPLIVVIERIEHHQVEEATLLGGKGQTESGQEGLLSIYNRILRFLNNLFHCFSLHLYSIKCYHLT